MLCTQSSSTVFKDANLHQEFIFPMKSLRLQNGMLFPWNKQKLYANLRLSIWCVLCFCVQQWIIKLHVESLPKLRGLKISCQIALLLLEVESFLIYRNCFCTTRHTVLHNSKHKTWISEKLQDGKKTELHTLKILCSRHKDLIEIWNFFLCTYPCMYVNDEHSYTCREGRT